MPANRLHPLDHPKHKLQPHQPSPRGLGCGSGDDAGGPLLLDPLCMLGGAAPSSLGSFDGASSDAGSFTSVATSLTATASVRGGRGGPQQTEAQRRRHDKLLNQTRHKRSLPGLLPSTTLSPVGGGAPDDAGGGAPPRGRKLRPLPLDGEGGDGSTSANDADDEGCGARGARGTRRESDGGGGDGRKGKHRHNRRSRSKRGFLRAPPAAAAAAAAVSSSVQAQWLKIAFLAALTLNVSRVPARRAIEERSRARRRGAVTIQRAYIRELHDTTHRTADNGGGALAVEQVKDDAANVCVTFLLEVVSCASRFSGFLHARESRQQRASGSLRRRCVCVGLALGGGVVRK